MWGWAALVGVIYATGNLMKGEAAQSRFRQQLGLALSRGTWSSWTKATSIAFVDRFDKIYVLSGAGGQGRTVVWTNVLLVFMAAIALSALSRLLGTPLTGRAVGSAVLALVFYVLADLVEGKKFSKWIKYPLYVLLIGVATFFVFQMASFEVILPWLPERAVAPAIATVILVSALNIAPFALRFLRRIQVSSGLSSSRSIDPVRAIVTSLSFLALIALLQYDSARPLVDSVREGHIDEMGFIGFNVFADAISLIQTRWILHQVSKRSLMAMPGLLMIDLLLSASIFLPLPLLSVGVRDMWLGIRFGGDQPWLRILFLTTFATSAMFYLFLASVLVLRLSEPVVRALRPYVDFQSEPIRGLTFVMVVLVTLAFLIAIVAAQIASSF